MSNLKDPFTFAMKHSLPVRLDAHRHKLEVDEEIVRKKLNRHEEPPTNLVSYQLISMDQETTFFKNTSHSRKVSMLVEKHVLASMFVDCLKYQSPIHVEYKRVLLV